MVPSWKQLDVLVPLLTIACIAVALRQLPWHSDLPPDPIAASPNPLTWPVVREWSRREEPLTTGPDMLGYDRIAARLYDAIVRPEEPAIALIGAIGFGKTSILNMVRRRFVHDNTSLVVFAHVNCWALPRAGDAPRIALERAVSALNHIVDAEALRGLPAIYSRLLAGEPTGTIGKILSSGRPMDATEQLHRFTPMLEAIDAKLLFIIEDAERAAPPFETRHLERLLWALRDVKRVSFVLSFDPNCIRFGYTKLCDYIERLPRLSVRSVEDILAPAYTHWRTGHEGYIDPLPEVRRDRLGLDRVTHAFVRYQRRLHGDSVADAITDLLTSPRNLKHFVRDVDRTWEALRGEVELDDVIVLTALRHSVPAAFDFVVGNAEAARSETDENDDLAGHAEKTVKSRWESLRSSLSDPSRVQILIDALELPKLRSIDFARGQPLLQGIHNDGPVDYLGRILAGRILPGETRDQDVLRDMVDWKDSDNGRMVERLFTSTTESDQYVAIWRHYGCHLSGPELLKIATTLTNKTLEIQEANATVGTSAMLAVWHCCEKRVSRDERRDWLIERIRFALPTSLGFANELFHYCASAAHGFTTEEDRGRVRNALVEVARESFATVDVLLAALGDEHEYPVAQLVRVDHQDEPSDPVPLDSWAWFVPVLIGAAAVDEDRIVPDVVNIVGNTEAGIQAGRVTRRFALDRERMTEFFGERTNEMVNVLAVYRGSDRLALAARAEARTWITELAEDPEEG